MTLVKPGDSALRLAGLPLERWDLTLVFFSHSALKRLLPLTTKKAIKEAGQSPVHSAAEGGRRHCLKLLLARGFNVNYRMDARNSESYRDMRRSALYFAVSNGDVDCTRLLLAAGARTDLDPLCCLLVAVRSGCREIARLLLEAGADANCRSALTSDATFPTALQYCLKDEAMMRLLLHSGYDAEKCFRCNHGDDWDPLSGSDDSPETKEGVAVSSRPRWSRKRIIVIY